MKTPKRLKRTKAAKEWPPIYTAIYRSGQQGFMIDLGLVDGKRKRLTYATREEAETAREQFRSMRTSQGMAALTLPEHVRVDAAKANIILEPHGVSILDAARHYDRHVLAYKRSPVITELVTMYLDAAEDKENREDTIRDLRHRLGAFAEDFGSYKLFELTVDDLKDWINSDEHEWAARTKINFLTKLSQLYNFAVRRNWVDSNITEKIERPKVNGSTAHIFTAEQAEQLLTHANEFDLLPYIAIGLFAGIRATEMRRLNGRNINFDAKIITITPEMAKKRSQRHVDMQPALLEWLAPHREKLTNGAPVVDKSIFRFRDNMASLRDAAGIAEWPDNGLRHSFGSYHFAMFDDENRTAKQMGNSPDMVHRHYKALVTKTEAERFWALRPKAEPQ